MPDVTVEKIREGEKLMEEVEKLKVEKKTFQDKNRILSDRCEILEATVHKLVSDLEKEKKAWKERLDCMENRLLTCVGTTMKDLAISFEKLKEARQNRAHAYFGEEALEAANRIVKEKIETPQSMEVLSKIWAIYNVFQQEIRFCKDAKLQGSLEFVYGQTNEAENSEAFEEFCEWKKARLEKVNLVRKVTDASLQNLVLSFSKIIQTSSRRVRSASQDATDKIRAKAIYSRKPSRADEKDAGRRMKALEKQISRVQRKTQQESIPSPVLTVTVAPSPQPALQASVTGPLNWSPEGDREQFSVFPTGNLQEKEQFPFDCLATGIEPHGRDRAFTPEATFMPTVAGLRPITTFCLCVFFPVKFFDIKSTILMKSKDVAFNVDEVLKNKLDEKDQKIILNVYHLIMQKILQEQDLINKVKQKYLESCEFRNLIVKWLDVTPNIDDLLLIKKRMKNIKAQLRWKLVEKHNLEESDNYSKSQMVKIKEEISALQDNMFQEIHNEQEEYNSGSLIVRLECNLLNAEPVKELSIKHPVMCSTIQEQKVLLKGYIADTNIETKIIERASKYHQVWKELKEESCLMQPMFLFLCKSDPIMYLMIPYYAGANLGTLQMTAPLIVQETLKVMKGVACGLSALHKADIIHGSLHKNNVFALNRKQGIVGDFDFTKSEKERALSNSMNLNGLDLISPELKNGQPPSPASDMYAFGCLLYWVCKSSVTGIAVSQYKLFIGKQEIKTNTDGTPQIDGLAMDDKVKSLLSQLLCYDNRMTAEQVLNADCFFSPDPISVPPESEGTEYDHGEQTSEIDMSDEGLDDETDSSVD
ncbi:hypothetical protein E2320_001885 [Naja naja]|nr:hypothetical protein E2320_001885 [Naja naja]